jgi:hypothetical protein
MMKHMDPEQLAGPVRERFFRGVAWIFLSDDLTDADVRNFTGNTVETMVREGMAVAVSHVTRDRVFEEIKNLAKRLVQDDRLVDSEQKKLLDLAKMVEETKVAVAPKAPAPKRELPSAGLPPLPKAPESTLMGQIEELLAPLP